MGDRAMVPRPKGAQTTEPGAPPRELGETHAPSPERATQTVRCGAALSGLGVRANSSSGLVSQGVALGFDVAAPSGHAERDPTPTPQLVSPSRLRDPI